jgi:hypothetical protein
MGAKKKEGEKYQPNQKPEIRITGVSKKTREEINNIADHLGTKVNHLLRPKLREWIESFPEHYRKPTIDKQFPQP